MKKPSEVFGSQPLKSTLTTGIFPADTLDIIEQRKSTPTIPYLQFSIHSTYDHNVCYFNLLSLEWFYMQQQIISPCSIHSLKVPQCIRSTLDDNLDCLQFVVLMNSASVNIIKYIVKSVYRFVVGV